MSQQDAQGGPVKREFTDESLRLADIVPLEGILNGYSFTRCKILGPAVLFIEATTVIAGADIAGTLDTFIWNRPPAKLAGAVWVPNCTFFHCEFLLVGFTGEADILEGFRATFNQ